MKLVLEIADSSYQTVLNFVSLLPEEQCRILPEETAAENSSEIKKDKTFGKAITQRVLPENSKLMVALTINGDINGDILPENLTKYLISLNNCQFGSNAFYNRLSNKTKFVEITANDGVFLQFKGLNQVGISTGSIDLPPYSEDVEAKAEQVDSLNFAFTRLSEKYEPWRKAHTGNVYERIFYQEKNNKWYPLDVMRSSISAKDDQHELVMIARKKAMSEPSTDLV